MLYFYPWQGAEIRFRRLDINRLPRKPKTDVISTITANPIASAWAKVKSVFAPSYSFAPALV